MPHYAMDDRLYRAVWITGEPGVGYDTLGGLLGGQSIEQLSGYRTSHRLPREWLSSVPKLRYHMTDPEVENPFFYGFGQNLVEIAALPWRAIVFLVVSEKTMIERVVAFREKTPDTWKDEYGTDHEEVGRMQYRAAQARFKSFAAGVGYQIAKRTWVVQNEAPPKVTARVIRRIFNRGLELQDSAFDNGPFVSYEGLRIAKRLMLYEEANL